MPLQHNPTIQQH